MSCGVSSLTILTRDYFINEPFSALTRKIVVSSEGSVTEKIQAGTKMISPCTVVNGEYPSSLQLTVPLLGI